MTPPQHTPEAQRWTIKDDDGYPGKKWHAIDETGRGRIVFYDRPTADLVVACVNACASLSPEAVPLMREALKHCRNLLSVANLMEAIEVADAALAAAKAGR